MAVIKNLLTDEINIAKAAELLGCSTRTIKRYKRAFLTNGRDGLIDHRYSNNHRLSREQISQIIQLKARDRWRSGRNIRDKLDLPVSEITVGNIIRAAGLSRQNITRVKPIQRFEASYPNELWQCDIMGKIDFPKIGVLYLIAAIDDHRRFCLSGRWFKTQGKMNVFQVWYQALSRWGVPEKMLQDEGSQYKARTRFGTADYQWYAKALGIDLIWAKKAQTKGKIERLAICPGRLRPGSLGSTDT